MANQALSELLSETVKMLLANDEELWIVSAVRYSIILKTLRGLSHPRLGLVDEGTRVDPIELNRLCFRVARDMNGAQSSFPVRNVAGNLGLSSSLVSPAKTAWRNKLSPAFELSPSNRPHPLPPPPPSYDTIDTNVVMLNVGESTNNAESAFSPSLATMVL
ncbi:hypothetical protein IAR55_004620 [Kwoniella newhampshirensis]|uniref:Uncharacterized protein n=1 Tax=Kwoniella newhampshirensis TaxID=1651941 RepID=A0AAW0Z0X4_9TREE